MLCVTPSVQFTKCSFRVQLLYLGSYWLRSGGKFTIFIMHWQIGASVTHYIFQKCSVHRPPLCITEHLVVIIQYLLQVRVFMTFGCPQVLAILYGPCLSLIFLIFLPIFMTLWFVYGTLYFFSILIHLFQVFSAYLEAARAPDTAIINHPLLTCKPSREAALCTMTTRCHLCDCHRLGWRLCSARRFPPIPYPASSAATSGPIACARWICPTQWPRTPSGIQYRVPSASTGRGAGERFVTGAMTTMTGNKETIKGWWRCRVNMEQGCGIGRRKVGCAMGERVWVGGRRLAHRRPTRWRLREHDGPAAGIPAWIQHQPLPRPSAPERPLPSCAPLYRHGGSRLSVPFPPQTSSSPPARMTTSRPHSRLILHPPPTVRPLSNLHPYFW